MKKFEKKWEGEAEIKKRFKKKKKVLKALKSYKILSLV